jgi:hypothetical protein
MELKLDVKKLNGVIKELQKELGEAFLATDIWMSSDAQSLAAYNPQPAAVALFTRITDIINKTLKDSGFPQLNNYHLLHLEGGHISALFLIGEFFWGILLDAKKTQLGLVLNVIAPKTMEAVKEAVAA